MALRAMESAPDVEGAVMQDQTIEHEDVHPLEEWRAGLIDLAVRVSKEILIRFQWTDPSDDVLRASVTKLLERHL
jgi:L-lysine 2,3-aminomutase